MDGIVASSKRGGAGLAAFLDLMDDKCRDQGGDSSQQSDCAKHLGCSGPRDCSSQNEKWTNAVRTQRTQESDDVR